MGNIKSTFKFSILNRAHTIIMEKANEPLEIHLHEDIFHSCVSIFNIPYYPGKPLHEYDNEKYLFKILRINTNDLRIIMHVVLSEENILKWIVQRMMSNQVIHHIVDNDLDYLAFLTKHDIIKTYGYEIKVSTVYGRIGAKYYQIVPKSTEYSLV